MFFACGVIPMTTIGTPMASMPDARRHRVDAGTGLPSVSMLSLGEISGLICNFSNVAARKIAGADSSVI